MKLQQVILKEYQTENSENTTDFTFAEPVRTYRQKKQAIWTDSCTKEADPTNKKIKFHKKKTSTP
jgi:hypothetical protein